MFTGIVEEKGVVAAVSSDKITLKADKVLKDIKIGDSIAVNGVCLTVISFDSHSFSADIMPQTLRLSNLGMLKAGNKVNLERAVLASGRIGGHNVQGHIDGTGIIKSLTLQDNAVIMQITTPAHIMQYIVTRGFIAVDGVSLTITDHTDHTFSTSLVAATRKDSCLGELKVGDVVNLEADIIGKYVQKFMVTKQQSNITREFLSENGF